MVGLIGKSREETAFPVGTLIINLSGSLFLGWFMTVVTDRLPDAGNWRVRNSSLQLAWRWLKFQKGSALAQWYRERTADGRGDTRKTMIVALARKILIALWRYVTTGELPAGVVLRPAT